MHLSAEQVPLYKLVIAVYIYLYNIIMYVVDIFAFCVGFVFLSYDCSFFNLLI